MSSIQNRKLDRICTDNHCNNIFIIIIHNLSWHKKLIPSANSLIATSNSSPKVKKLIVQTSTSMAHWCNLEKKIFFTCIFRIIHDVWLSFFFIQEKYSSKAIFPELIFFISFFCHEKFTNVWKKGNMLIKKNPKISINIFFFLQLRLWVSYGSIIALKNMPS